MFKTAVLTELYEKHQAGWSPVNRAEVREAAVRRYAEDCDEQLRKIGHNLVRAWNRFKRHHHSAALTGFDSVVSNLDRWRALRYPEVPIGQGLTMATNPEKGPVPTSLGEHGERLPMYHLCLEDVDELFAVIAPLEFSSSAIQTSIERALVPGAGLETYKERNKHAIL
jgi:hypothetical protein